MELVQPRLEIPLRSIQERITLNPKKYLDMNEICWGLGDQILINHPCLEFWFLLHYELKNFGYDCSDIIRYLKKNFSEFKTYDKSEKEAKKVTDKLKDKLQIAIEHAKKRDCNFESLINCSEMYRLFEKIESIKS